jgi:hypothetical protein
MNCPSIQIYLGLTNSLAIISSIHAPAFARGD